MAKHRSEEYWVAYKQRRRPGFARRCALTFGQTLFVFGLFNMGLFVYAVLSGSTNLVAVVLPGVTAYADVTVGGLICFWNASFWDANNPREREQNQSVFPQSLR